MQIYITLTLVIVFLYSHTSKNEFVITCSETITHWNHIKTIVKEQSEVMEIGKKYCNNISENLGQGSHVVDFKT